MRNLKGIYVLLIAIIGMFAVTAGFSSCSDSDSASPPAGPTGPDTVLLGTAADFAILSATAVTTTGSTAITGDVGINAAGSSYTGFAQANAGDHATSALVTGFMYASDMDPPTPANMITAVADMAAAYTDAAGRVTPDFTELNAGDLGGLTLEPGLYKWTTAVTIPTDVTLSGNGVYIFQIDGTLSIAAATSVILDGALPANIFWQTAGGATLGADAVLKGNVLSATGIVFGDSAALDGRALAQTAVTLIANTIVKP